MEHSVPSIWMLSAEYDRIFSDASRDTTGISGTPASTIDDESGMIEVTSKDLAQRCLDLIWRERALY
jgi:hypothetical protein